MPLLIHHCFYLWVIRLYSGQALFRQVIEHIKKVVTLLAASSLHVKEIAFIANSQANAENIE